MAARLLAPALNDETVVVLDVDDTLYLEECYVRSGFRAVGRHLEASAGINGFDETLWSNFISGFRGDAFDRALPMHGLEPSTELITSLVEVYRCHVPDIALTPDATAFLDLLRGRPVAAITDGPPQSQRRKVEALGVTDLIDLVIYTGELGPGMSKPHHRAFELVEESFDVRPNQLVYIGDNPAKDFAAPRSRGWQTVRVRRPAGLHSQIESPDGTPEVTSLAELTHRVDLRVTR